MSPAPAQIALRPGADLGGFRRAARRLIGEQTPPESVMWNSGPSGDLFGESAARDCAPLMLPKAVGELIPLVVCNSDPERYALLYTLIWRVMQGERHLRDVASDPLVHRLQAMAKSVRRDIHKRHAFVRFREVSAGPSARFVAWFEPEHFIVEAVGDFFVDRFRGMDWAILTPKASLYWNRRELLVGPPAERSAAPDHDMFEAHWLAYYESTFNPARLNPPMMKGEMPVTYWKNLPEASLIPRLIHEASPRVEAMIALEIQMPQKRTPHRAVAAMAEQAPTSLDALNRIILDSEPPTPFSPRAVLGEGPIGARLAFVGEQPGDQEDLEGRP